MKRNKRMILSVWHAVFNAILDLSVCKASIRFASNQSEFLYSVLFVQSKTWTLVVPFNLFMPGFAIFEANIIFGLKWNETMASKASQFFRKIISILPKNQQIFNISALFSHTIWDILTDYWVCECDCLRQSKQAIRNALTTAHNFGIIPYQFEWKNHRNEIYLTKWVQWVCPDIKIHYVV